MARYVCDTSVIVKWFSEENEPNLEQARALLRDWRRGYMELLTCDLAVGEPTNALQRGKGLSPERVKEAIRDFFDLPMELRPPHRELAEAAADLAGEYRLTNYDACFLALARMEGCQLITADPRHHGKVRDGVVLMLEHYPDRRDRTGSGT